MVIMFALFSVFLFCATLSSGASFHSVFSFGPFKASKAHVILFGNLESLVDTESSELLTLVWPMG